MTSKPTPPPEEDFKIPVLMLAIIVIPAMIALSRVQYAVPLMPPPPTPLPQPLPRDYIDDTSPYGYTWSLTLFLVPAVVLAVWFLRHPKYHVEKRSFWGTVLLLSPLGFALDIFLGNSFFKFINKGAVLGIYFPGYKFGSGWSLSIPIEEFAFYFLGFLAVLLLYIWCDLYWVADYSTDNSRPAEDLAAQQLVSLHFPSLGIALGLIGAALLYKYFGPMPDHYHQGFPGYFTFLVLAGLVPAFLFFPVAKPLVNWRAFSVTLFMVLLISLLWEATLAVPYQWWGYNYDQMIGMVVRPWDSLPVEATIVWLVVTWATVIFYEVMRSYFYLKASKKREPVS